jgi:hypothetical protein
MSFTGSIKIFFKVFHLHRSGQAIRVLVFRAVYVCSEHSFVSNR